LPLCEAFLFSAFFFLLLVDVVVVVVVAAVVACVVVVDGAIVVVIVLEEIMTDDGGEVASGSALRFLDTFVFPPAFMGSFLNVAAIILSRTGARAWQILRRVVFSVQALQTPHSGIRNTSAFIFFSTSATAGFSSVPFFGLPDTLSVMLL